MKRTKAFLLCVAALIAVGFRSSAVADPPPPGPVTVVNPWLVNDRVADCRSLETMAATFDKSYSPDGVVAPAPADIQARAINEYNNFKRRLYHWGNMPSNNRDVVEQMNVFGWALCGSHAGMNAAILQAMGLHPRVISIAGGGHTIYEVEYDGAWHCLDTMTTYHVWSRTNPRYIVSMAEVKFDKSLALDAVAEGRACPGFLLCGDTADYFASGSDTWQVIGDPGSSPTTKSMNMDLRAGESLKRTCESWSNQFTTASVTPPYHHEASRDWKDTVNYPYWEPYKLDSAGNSAIGITYSATYRRWANGTLVLQPDFRSAGYQACVASSANIATFHDDGLTPDLHANALNTPAEVVFHIFTPFLITDASIDGTFVRAAGGDINRIYTSSNGTTWTQAWDNTALGTTQLSGFNIRSAVAQKYDYWVKVMLQAGAARTDAGVSGLRITTIFEHNKGGMPYLDKGVNHVTLTFDNPAQLQAAGQTLHVVYKWKEYDGADWTIDKQFESYATASPTTFTISTAGAKVPRTEHIVLEVVPPLADAVAPARVANLAAGIAQANKVPLAWTASGDDDMAGTANAYDLRCSTSPITDDASFLAATRIEAAPVPRPAGSAESFTATGLAGDTTYWFALKVSDDAGNASPLSNVISVRTTPPDATAPEAIADLAGEPGAAAGTVNLAWTAPADLGYGGVGPFPCATYDLRYSTSPIDEANFAAATAVNGAPGPKVPGAAESFTVTALQGRTTYYFAIRSVDETGNVSAISNVATVRTTGQLVLAPVADVGLYGDSVDNCFTNRGTDGRLTIGPVQDGLMKFDLAGRLAPDEMITGVTLQLYTSRQGYSFNLFVVAYPMAAPWQEGIGNSGTVGGVGWPWGPASIGDVTYAYKEVTAVGLGMGVMANTIVATDGVPWAIQGGRGVGTDVVDRQMFGTSWARTVGPNDPLSSAMPAIPLSPSGLAVVRAWCSGTLENHGLNMWATSGTGGASLTTREYNGMPPQLVLSIGIAGDISGDGHVDVVDLLTFAAAWASAAGDSNYDVSCDFDGSGNVDVIDLLTLAGTFGRY